MVYKCKYDQRKCEVRGCISEEFYESCYNLCKLHKKQYGRRHARQKALQYYKSLAPAPIVIPPLFRKSKKSKQ